MEWVSAKESIEALGGSPSEAADSALARSIMRHAFEGRIGARAGELQRIGRGPIEKEIGAELPSEFWRLTKGYVVEQDWIAGRFVAVVTPPGVYFSEEWRAYGVQFCKEDLEAIGGRFGPAPDRAVKSDGAPVGRTPGRKYALDRWQSFYFAVLDLQRSGRLNKTHFPTRVSLWYEIEARMDHPFTEEHARKAVREVYERFIGD